ncbi:hypothetical protein COK06_12470 [Bacillus cereus]|nr:hypothetical protein CN428_15305 [Bacillus cereus]PEZ87327.1 hypothetical protein CN374_18765 [Bacillus cereus]PFA30132.1 hypothetical protein CN390_20525 [Bacillus cereus]PFB96330.1 hypothetical protein CN296_18280 [Bacillus cereus]PFI36731.1 hypothetical protein COI72_18335 [Bacillus cereus]
MRANVGKINFIKLTEKIKPRRPILCLYSNTVWHHPICAPTPTLVICEAREGEQRSIPSTVTGSQLTRSTVRGQYYRG